ncbi:hypothetical protein JHW41_11570 [Lysobacter enzymogenes]|nr:hypothetical protein JHW41_11570 [Lysobacter enzymogenes]
MPVDVQSFDRRAGIASASFDKPESLRRDSSESGNLRAVVSAKLHAVIPAKAGTHFDLALGWPHQEQSQNGFRLSPE